MKWLRVDSLISALLLALAVLTSVHVHFRYYNGTPTLTYVTNTFLKRCNSFWLEHDCDGAFYLSQPLDVVRRHERPDTFLPFYVDDLVDLRRVMLVIFFKTATTHNSSEHLLALYGATFGSVTFCWPKFNELVNNSIYEGGRNIFYKTPGRDPGQTSYLCLEEALRVMDRNLAIFTDGVLVVAEDVILNAWNFAKMGKLLNKNWLLQPGEDNFFEVLNGSFCNGFSTDNAEDCYIQDWNWSTRYRLECIDFWYELEQIYEISPEAARADKRFYGRSLSYWRYIRFELVRKAALGELRMFGKASGDMFYISKRYFQRIIPMLKLLAKHGVYKDIAVATAIRTVTPRPDMQLIDMRGFNRTKSLLDSYSTEFELVHSFDLSRAFKNDAKELTCVYCNLLNLNLAYVKEFSQVQNI